MIRHPCLLLPFSLALFGRAVQSTDRNRFFLFLLHLPPLPHFLSPAACWQQERREKECLVSETVTRNIHAAAAQRSTCITASHAWAIEGGNWPLISDRNPSSKLVSANYRHSSPIFNISPPRRMRKHTVARERLGVGANG